MLPLERRGGWCPRREERGHRVAGGAEERQHEDGTGGCGHRDPGVRTLQPRVDRVTFEGEHAEDALVDAPQRLARDESIEGFETQRVLARGERSLPPDAAVPQPRELAVEGVLRPVDDAEVLAAADLHAGLHPPVERPFAERLHDHAFAAGPRPP